KVRQGQSEQRKQQRRAVDPTAAFFGGKSGEQERGENRHEHGTQRQLQGCRKARANNHCDTLLFVKRTTEVAERETCEEGSILFGQGTVESQASAQFFFIRGAGGLAEHDVDGIARNQVDQKKDQSERAEQSGQQQQQSMDEISLHVDGI